MGHGAAPAASAKNRGERNLGDDAADLDAEMLVDDDRLALGDFGVADVEREFWFGCGGGAGEREARNNDRWRSSVGGRFDRINRISRIIFWL